MPGMRRASVWHMALCKAEQILEDAQSGNFYLQYPGVQRAVAADCTASAGLYVVSAAALAMAEKGPHYM